MSTIIRIDPDDELPIILERLPAGGSCVLVVPPHARALNSVVGAKLLSRRAATLGSRVAVVTDDHAVMAHARAAGVPAAETVEEAERLLNGDGAGGAETEQTVVWNPGAGAHATDADEMDGAALPGAGEAPATGPANASGNDPAHATDDGQGDAGAPGVRGHSGASARGGAATGAATGAGAASRPVSRPHPRPPQRSSTSTSRRPGSPLVTAALVIVPLVLLALAANYVLGGILNPSATLTLSARATLVPATATLRAVRHLPTKKRGRYLLAMADATQSEHATVPLPVRGHRLLPDRPATGRLLLGNLTAKPLFVPHGTTFTTALNKAVFVSTSDITLQPATETFTMTLYGTGYVPISATTGGSAGNVPKGAIVNVPASLSGALKVENEAPTYGGTDRPVPDIKPQDLTTAAASLFGVLIEEARHDIARRFNGDVEQHNISVVYSPLKTRLAPDRRSATLALAVTVHAVYIHKHDVKPAVSDALHSVMDTMPNATLLSSSVAWTSAWSPGDPITQTITLAITAHATRPLDVAGILKSISGKSKASALAYLHSRPDIAAASIKLNPPWADTVPSDVTRIHPVVGTPQ